MVYDVVFIGGGPAGYVGAIRASQLGLKTALVEDKHLGGICCNWGCIPTKALLRSAEVYHNIMTADVHGIEVSKVRVNIEEMVKRSRDVASKLNTGIGGLLKKNKVEYISGRGYIVNPKKVMVAAKDGKDIPLETKNIVIATGSRPRILPDLKADGKHILTYKEAMIPADIPKKLLIVGSGAIGVEFASFYNTIGTEVHLVEMQPNILPVEDIEISTMARKAFEQAGIKIYTKSKIASAKVGKNGVEVTIDNEDKRINLAVDRIITAVGIVANIEELGIENTKVKIENGQIKINDQMRTDEPTIYAVGDVVGAPWLAHKASHEAIIAAEVIAGKKTKPVNRMNIPGCTYSMPQIASIGLTEEKAKAAGYQIKVGKFPFIGSGKAIALGEPNGLIKTIYDAKTGELLGAHMIGAEVTELISNMALLRTLEGTEEDIMHTIFPHPTLSETLHESTLAAYNRAIHI